MNSKIIKNISDTQQVAAETIRPIAQGLYDPANEHDACGVGFVAHIKGKKSHAIVAQMVRDF
jgi:glutamate synthase (NADPH/NADH) large chain